MAGKRHYGTVDHIMHNKLSRLEVASRRSTSCFKIAPSQDLQTYQNFMTYSTSDTEGLGSSSPWSATAAYLQYAGNALSEHMQSRESSVKYQRPHNPLQLTDSSNNPVSIHQNPPVHSYHMSHPQACPTIAMPTPVYRSPSHFMDPAYNLRGLQSLGVCVASQPTCPPTMEWNSSARFAHSSSPLYASGTKKHLSTPNSYPEVAGSQSSLSLGLQEQNPLYRHRADMSPAVDVSSKCSQKNTFKEAFHTQQNGQLFYTEGNVPLGRQRSSAFTTPSPQHNNKPSAYQGNLDHHMGQLYSKNIYGNLTNSIHQRSSPFSSSIELTGSPHSARGGSVYPNQAQHMHSGYVSEKPRVQTSHLDGTLQASEGSFKVKPDTRKTITEIPMCSPQREKNFLMQSYHMNKDIWGMSNRTDNEMLFNLTPGNRSLQERTPHQEPYARQSTHSSFVQPSSSSVMTPIVSSHELFSGQRASSHSVTLDKSSLHNSIHSFEHPRVTGVQPVENTTKRHSSRTHTNLEYAQSTDPRSSSVSERGSQYQMNPRNEGSKLVATALCPSSELPGSKSVDVYDSKSDPTSVRDNESIDNPKSPPMPVINDVFSLAPYRAYLEGNAPHPFPTHQEAEVENLASTSGFLEHPLPEDRTENVEGISNSNKVVNLSNMNVVKNQKEKDVQNRAQETSMQNASAESVVLDLSLKKIHQTGSFPCAQQTSCHVRDTLLTTAAENCLGKAKNQIKGQEGYVSSDTDRVFHSGQASSVIFESSQESCPPLSTDRLTSPAKENRLSKENLLCQRQKNISHTPKAFPWHRQEKYQSRAKETQKNNLEESRVSWAAKSLSNRQQDVDHSQNTERLPSQHQHFSPSEMTECLPQLLQNCSSQHYKSKSHNFQHSYKLHSNRSLSHQPQDNSFSQVPENMSQPDLSKSTSQTLRTLPVRTKVQRPTRSEFSVYVNTVQTQTSLVPVLLASPPTVYVTNTIALHTSQRPPIEGPGQAAKKTLESCHSLSSPSGSENESNGFHSSKSFMFRKYKMKKYSSSEEETQRVSTDSTSQNLSNPPVSDTVQSLPPSAPESSPALGEANVSLANVGEPLLNSSGKKFSELHRSLHRAITNAVSRSPSNMLEDWLIKTKEEEKSKIPVKTKNSLRISEPSSDLPDHDIWLTFDEVRLLLHKLLSQLETFMFTRHCPFPHVIRAGAIFIPIYLVKEGLFPELLGPAIDRVLQKHKVELRPTTLSEEKLLRETKLKDCPSRMLKLLALKQLPDVYPDLLCLFCRLTIQQELDKNTESLGKEELKLPDCSKKEPQSASPRKAKSSLILKLRRVRKHSGIHIYKTQSPKTPQKDKIQKRPVCRKKPRSARPLFTYKKKKRRKRFPNLVGRRILHLFDDGEQEAWFPGRVLRVHRSSRKLRDTQFEVLYDGEPGTRYFLELLQDYEKGWLQLDG
ncbi:hypothetical protein GDO78_005473 [Eleutherodactylus coqui]|uniref:Uncharacterized protein n=1 Tax=Eleutherodactylus coqui TaxID=57060 RepID=A0A8J6FK96_ELECQ|nr:hypothetical protein GDO78_005473 [Eleutherodactylus coqui]